MRASNQSFLEMKNYAVVMLQKSIKKHKKALKKHKKA
jgi:hypothetical protein